MNNKKRKALIIAVWLVCIAITAMVFTVVENGICYRRAEEELVDLSVSVSEQMPVMVEDDFLARSAIDKTTYSLLKALAYRIQHMEDKEQAYALLTDFAELMDLEKLTVYNRNDEVLFNIGGNTDLGGNSTAEILDSSIFLSLDQILDQPEVYVNSLFSSLENDEYADVYGWGTEDNNMLISITNPKSDEEKNLIRYFSWKNILRRLKIGRTGYVLALTNDTGTILSHENPDYTGEAYTGLRIALPGSSRELPYAELQEAFANPGEVKKITVEDVPCYATRVRYDNAFMLALLPMQEVQTDAGSATSTIMLLVTLVTGIFVVHTLFHLSDPEDPKPRRNGKYHWRDTLAARLKVTGIISVVSILCIALYLESLSAYAETFRYTRDKVNSVVDYLDENDRASKMLQEWYQSVLKEKCETAGTILSHTGKEMQTMDFLSELAMRLGVETIARYDQNGKLIASNSPYMPKTLDPGDSFRILLQGKKSEVGPMEQDAVTGEVVQKAGISLQDAAGMPDGMILVVLDASGMDTIRSNMGVTNIFKQISLTDDTIVMAVSDPDMKVRYIAEIEQGKHLPGVNDFDYTGFSISQIGLSEKQLADHYNGNMFMLNNHYFASVRRVDSDYFLVLRPQVTLAARHLVPAGIATGATLLIEILILLSACIISTRQIAAAEQEVVQEEAPRESTVADDVQKGHGDDILAMIGSFINRKKPYFEERWPNDSTKWKDRSNESKFSTALNCILVVTLAVIIVHALLAGESSIWYYCINGEWDSGINLYSVTSCSISVAVLFVAKMIIHKLLYLIARAVSAKGETICNLLDSFTSYALVIAGIFICLANFGVSTTALSLTGGVAGVIFGIGCQNIVADILAGILMTFEGVARVGDFVSYNGKFGVILSIGVRTTRLKWFSEVTIVRNNEFKNYIYMPADKQDRVVCFLTIDMHESIERVESILDTELPKIHEHLCEISGSEINGPRYRGVQRIEENGITLSFAIFCPGKYYGWMSRTLNRELKLMCERNDIKIALPQVVVHEPGGAGTAGLPEE